MNANLDVSKDFNKNYQKSNKKPFSRSSVRLSVVNNKKKLNFSKRNASVKLKFNSAHSKESPIDSDMTKRNFDIFCNFDDPNTKELVELFNNILCESLENLQTVYLEKFGFLIPQKITDIDYDDSNDVLCMQKEQVLKISYEKCLILNSYFKEKYNPVEFKSLIKNLYSQSNNELIKKYTLSDLLKYEEYFVNTIKKQVINNGVCNLLKIGTLYSIHNRQGEVFDDWFSGAEILFKQKLQKSYLLTESHKYIKPVYKDALEVFRTAYGDEVGVINVNLKKELVMLGFDLEDVKSIKEPTLPLYVFEDRSLSQKGIIILNYVTNTVRKYGISEFGVGTEFVFQIVVYEKDYRNKNGTLNIPNYPKKAFAASLVMLQKEELRRENASITVKYDVPLIEDNKKKLDAICVLDFEALSSIQYAKDGKFFYKNIVGITLGELEFANNISIEYILDILKEKNLHQITRLKRRSITEKTEAVSVNF